MTHVKQLQGGNKDMFLNYNNINGADEAIDLMRICFGCETGCFLRCIGCSGCSGCKTTCLGLTS